MNHLEFAFRNLQRRRTRSILTILGVAFAVGSFITLYGLSRSVHENVERSFDEHGTDLTVKRRGIAEPFGGTIPESLIPEIAKIPGVAAVSGQLITFAATDNDDNVLAAGWAADGFYWANVPLKDGRVPTRDERMVALVGYDIARTLGKKVGDEITLLGENFRIVGLTDYHSIINLDNDACGPPGRPWKARSPRAACAVTSRAWSATAAARHFETQSAPE